MRRLAPAICSSRNTRGIQTTSAIRGKDVRAQPVHSLPELHQLARNLGAPNGNEAGEPLTIVLVFLLRVNVPTLRDSGVEKSALVSRSVQADLFQALQNQVQSIEQVSLAQPPMNNIVHPDHAIEPYNTRVSVAWKYQVAFKITFGTRVGVCSPPGVAIVKISCASGASRHCR